MLIACRRLERSLLFPVRHLPFEVGFAAEVFAGSVFVVSVFALAGSVGAEVGALPGVGAGEVEDGATGPWDLRPGSQPLRTTATTAVLLSPLPPVPLLRNPYWLSRALRVARANRFSATSAGCSRAQPARSLRRGYPTEFAARRLHRNCSE